MLIQSNLRSTALGILLGVLPLSSTIAAGPQLLEAHCSTCHKQEDGTLSRISEQRKTPEAWQMTILRMRNLHGLEIDGETQRLLVQYLADTQGMAPSETTGLRYALDRSPAAQEPVFKGNLQEMCGRCHTTARAVLQRRSPGEWRTHIDFHIGQYPTTEYQALGRDREWYKLAVEEVVPLLSADYPLETEAWTKWQAADKPNPVGSWAVASDLAGVGPVFGNMTVSAGKDGLVLEGELQTLAGKQLPLKGKVNIYTGYEWRGGVTLGDEKYRQILALSEDGSRLEGRHFAKGSSALSTPFHAIKQGSGAKVLAMYPENIRAGKNEAIHVIGADLETLTANTPGMIVSQQATDYGTKIQLLSPEGSAGKQLTLKSGAAEAVLPIYDKPDRLTVEPPYAVARVGGNGGSTPPANVWFKAVGWLNGADGKPETEDDIRIGTLEPDWQLESFNEEAEKMKDEEYVGQLNNSNGLFMAAGAGPNSERTFSTNNAGNMKVIADFDGVKGEAQMIVTVQRWVDPPLR